MNATNVTRFLDAHKVEYTAYELPSEKLGAVETARLLGIPPAYVYKTIVVTRKSHGKPILAVVPGDREVKLKSLAQAVGEKKVFLAKEREAEEITGLLAGGISPLALINRGFQVIIDAHAHSQDSIYISGGERGLNIRPSPSTLAKITNARFADIS